MNALARYLLVFLLGWSGAVFSYSDLIYPKKKAPLTETTNEQGIALDKEANKPTVKTEDSSLKGLKLPPTARGRFIQKSKKESEKSKP